MATDESEAPAEVPEDMAGRSGLRAYVRTGDEHLAQRPEEVLARLARAMRLHAITDAVLFPDSPALRAQWDKARARWVSPTTREPVDAVAIRDRAVHLHRGGESAPTTVIPFARLDDLVRYVLALEELERFRGLTSTRVPAGEIAALVREVRELGGALAELRDEVQSGTLPGADRGTVETREEDRPGAHLALVGREASPDPSITPPELPREPTTPTPLGARAWSAVLSVGSAALWVLDLERRDGGALAWLSLAACLSAYTTHHGAISVGLPPHFATAATLFVCGFLWTLLAGAALKHAPVVKLGTELLLASVCVYCGFFTYYDAITVQERTATASNVAAETHAALVGELYGDHAAELEAMRKERAAAQRSLDEEVERGASTGRAGYGPIATGLASELRTLDRELARLDGRLAALGAVATTPIDGLSPDEVLELDLRIWTAAPAEWRGERPHRDAYVDLAVASSSVVLLPLDAIRREEPNAYLSLVCAGAVEGVMIVCGFVLERRRRERLVQRATRAGTRLARELRDAARSVGHAVTLEARPRYTWLDDDEVPRA